ncbi:MAG: glutamate mutase L [Spirochaetaceae bacterium]|nr:glutamate mutase L [Spirochaetaceae bacterium]
MNIDVLVAEIGSTTTLVNAFNNIESEDPVFLGQGSAPTSIKEGDVRIGLNTAIINLKNQLIDQPIEITWNSFFATSSAAGGLRMTVHGLVYDMTVKAAKEAALGAGANIHQITAGKMRQSDIDRMISINPNIIMIAGGVDYGERDTAIINAEAICNALNLTSSKIPVIYAGNIENQDEIKRIFSNYKGKLIIVDNVYPRIDDLQIVPARNIIQEVFEEHIIHAPGMEYIRDMVDGPIVPTPGGVMLAAEILKESIGDLIVIDVGGATTDIHSVTNGSEEISRILISPEPYAKRTVEGDLGIYINRENVLKLLLNSKKDNDTKSENYKNTLIKSVENLGSIPITDEEKNLAKDLTQMAATTALERHAGTFRDLYGPQGKTKVAEGRDLTAVKYCIGTGGALTRLEGGLGILHKVMEGSHFKKLYPGDGVKFLIDKNYTMASLGVLSKQFPKAAVNLLKQSLELSDE